MKTRHFAKTPSRQSDQALYLVTGGKSGLLVLARHKSARIITARDFAAFFAADAP